MEAYKKNIDHDAQYATLKAKEALGLLATGNMVEISSSHENMTGFVVDIIRDVNLTHEQILAMMENDTLLGAFKEVIRYDETEWNIDDDQGDLAILLGKIYEHYSNDTLSHAADLPASTIIDIRAVGPKPVGAMARIDVLGKYSSLRSELSDVAIAAGNRFSNPGVLHDLLGDLRNEVSSMLQKCDTDLREGCSTEIEHTNKVSRIGAFAEVLSTMNDALRDDSIDLQTYVEIFPTLSKHKRLHANLRKLAFALTFQKRLPLQNMFTELPDEPNINAVEQIEYFLNDEVIGNVFSEAFEQKYLENKFKRICKTGPIAKSTHNKAGNTSYVRKVQFIPTKNPLLEFSGYIGDTCYTPQGELIAKLHPNVTAVIMKQINQGTQEERFVGSCLLIDTTDEAGKPCVVIRALNPTENLINKLSVSDFYDHFAAYVKSAASEKSARVGIVIDNRSGGAATNRPLLFNHLKKLRDEDKLKKMSVNRQDSTINGFDISDKVYEV